jgi:hypothetical protein
LAAPTAARSEHFALAASTHAFDVGLASGESSVVVTKNVLGVGPACGAIAPGAPGAWRLATLAGTVPWVARGALSCGAGARGAGRTADGTVAGAGRRDAVAAEATAEPSPTPAVRARTATAASRATAGPRGAGVGRRGRGDIDIAAPLDDQRRR